MSEIRRVNTGDAPRNVYHAGDAPRTVNTGRTVKTGSALNQDCLLYTSPSPRDS